MTVLQPAPLVFWMSVKKILRMAFRIVDLAIGIVPPKAGPRASCGDLAEKVGMAGGKLTSTIADDRGSRSHLFDFALTAG